LSFMLYPEAFNRPNARYLQHFTMLSVRRADRVIAVSESTKGDVVRLLGVAPEKVAVVYHGVENEFRPLDQGAEMDEFRARVRLPERFILCFGTLEPRKNLATLIAAYALLRKESRLPHKLVIAGGKGWRFEHVFAAVDEAGLQDDVLFPGYVPSDEQPMWYNAAEVFAYPSLYEGFGFPPLEALACGTPVVASNRSSLPEVVGDAGLLVDPLDAVELAEALRRVLTDGGLRQELVARGLARAQSFSWSRAARETVEVYHGT
jgi:glycosyltransferase involved in cell wall biosynthesis